MIRYDILGKDVQSTSTGFGNTRALTIVFVLSISYIGGSQDLLRILEAVLKETKVVLL